MIGVLDGELVLVTRQLPGDLVVAVTVGAADKPGRVILSHKVHIGFCAEFGGHIPQDRPGLLQHPRHHQVAHQQPAPGQAVLTQAQRADLAVHLGDCLAGRLRAAGHPQVAAGPPGAQILRSGT